MVESSPIPTTIHFESKIQNPMVYEPAPSSTTSPFASEYNDPDIQSKVNRFIQQYPPMADQGGHLG